MLSLQALSKSFKQGSTLLSLFNAVSCRFQQGKTYALTGASGVGKSTLLHLIAGIESPTAGAIFFDDKELAFLRDQERHLFYNQDIGIIFQLPYLINELTVLENVMLKGILGKRSWTQSKNHALELLEQLAIADKADQAPQSLSGGQQQRVAIARALFNKPRFLCADEPTGNLDEAMSKQLLKLLLAYQKKYNMGLIISTHDPMVIAQMEIKITLKDGSLHHDQKVDDYVQENSSNAAPFLS